MSNNIQKRILLCYNVKKYQCNEVYDEKKRKKKNKINRFNDNFYNIYDTADVFSKRL